MSECAPLDAARDLLARGFAPVPASDLIRSHPDMRPVVIADLLREGEVLNVIAAPKVGKSWVVHTLAVAVVAGVAWLGKRTERGDVLLIDAELHRETLAARLRAMQCKLAVAEDEMARLHVWPVRGRRWTIELIADALAGVPRGTYRLIVLDALYRFLPTDGEENANETMTRVYNTLDAIADKSGAAVVVVHHATKGDQSAKAVTDVGAGAGAQSRAPDSHLILRPHEEDGAVVVEAAVRSFPPPVAFVIRREHPGWMLAPDLDPRNLRRPPRKKSGTKEKSNVPPDGPPPEPWTPERFAREVVGSARSIREDAIARAREIGLGKGQAEDLLKRAEAAGLVFRHAEGPCAAHRFSIERPSALHPTEGDGEGVGAGASPPPGVDRRGGTGGSARPPSPPPARKRKARRGREAGDP